MAQRQRLPVLCHRHDPSSAMRESDRLRPCPPASTSSSAPNSAELDAKELDRLAKELSADFRGQGMKAFDGKF